MTSVTRPSHYQGYNSRGVLINKYLSSLVEDYPLSSSLQEGLDQVALSSLPLEVSVPSLFWGMSLAGMGRPLGDVSCWDLRDVLEVNVILNDFVSFDVLHEMETSVDQQTIMKNTYEYTLVYSETFIILRSLG